MTNNEQELERTNYDNWKLGNRDDERIRTGHGGKYGTVEYEYMVSKIGKCPCCEEDILEDELFVEDDNILYHFSCYNYMKAEEEKRNGKQ